MGNCKHKNQPYCQRIGNDLLGRDRGAQEPVLRAVPEIFWIFCAMGIIVEINIKTLKKEVLTMKTRRTKGELK